MSDDGKNANDAKAAPVGKVCLIIK